ncbi:MAG: sigma-70 family RNA polymerase sigma factor [Spirochaetales bacterium]|nr:MAG: sigma-70 family RNA polymerase sigma factor [Spirochaetales bacterium]
MEFVDGRTLKEDAMDGGSRARAAFERLWAAYYVRLRAFARTWKAIGPSAADDAAAEALITAFRGLHLYEPAAPLTPWIYTVARRRFGDIARALARHPASGFVPGQLEALPDTSDGPEQAAIDGDLAGRVRAAMSGLPEEDRRLAVLRFYEELTSAQIGRICGMPSGTVRWRLGLIKRRLASMIGGENHDMAP